MVVKFLIGTSGWHYDDWVGRFYPRYLLKKKDDWFSFYARHFDTVEINSTFYSFPKSRTVESWIRKVRGLDGPFTYSIKLPQSISHSTMVEGKTDEAVRSALDFQRSCLLPLSNGGCMGMLLLQLSPYFRNDRSNAGKNGISILFDLLEALDTDLIPTCVEFRHHSWIDEETGSPVKEVSGWFHEHNVTTCTVDGPGSMFSVDNTTDHAYIRLHGRNRDMWFAGNRIKDVSDHYETSNMDSDMIHDGDGDPEMGFRNDAKRDTVKDTRMNRYDYLYSKQELQGIVKKMSDLKDIKGTASVYFNNHPNGNAAFNALSLMEMLGIGNTEKDFPISSTSSQLSLTDF